MSNKGNLLKSSTPVLILSIRGAEKERFGHKGEVLRCCRASGGGGVTHGAKAAKVSSSLKPRGAPTQPRAFFKGSEVPVPSVLHSLPSLVFFWMFWRASVSTRENNFDLVCSCSQVVPVTCRFRCSRSAGAKTSGTERQTARKRGHLHAENLHSQRPVQSVRCHSYLLYKGTVLFRNEPEKNSLSEVVEKQKVSNEILFPNVQIQTGNIYSVSPLHVALFSAG